jgi:Lon protease-like protein
MSRPFQIFEPRYREMVTDAVQGDGYLGMVLLQPGYGSLYEGNPAVYSVGCAGEITEAEELADGRWLIVLRGMTRFRVVSEDQSRSYRVATVEALDEQFDSDAQRALQELRPSLSQAFTELAPSAESPPPDLSDEDLVNALSQFVELAPEDRQVLLEAAGPLERAEVLLEMVQ